MPVWVRECIYTVMVQQNGHGRNQRCGAIFICVLMYAVLLYGCIATRLLQRKMIIG